MRLFGRKNKEGKEKTQNQKLQEAVLTLYACRKGTEAVPEAAKQVFSDMMERIVFPDKNEFVIQLTDGTSIRFHMETDPRETEIQAQGMAQFFSRAPLENDKVKKAALCQIQLFNSIIGIRFWVNENENRTNDIVGRVYRIAKELSAFVLYPNMYLFYSDGRLLLSIDGKSD